MPLLGQSESTNPGVNRPDVANREKNSGGDPIDSPTQNHNLGLDQKTFHYSNVQHKCLGDGYYKDALLVLPTLTSTVWR